MLRQTGRYTCPGCCCAVCCGLLFVRAGVCHHPGGFAVGTSLTVFPVFLADNNGHLLPVRELLLAPARLVYRNEMDQTHDKYINTRMKRSPISRTTPLKRSSKPLRKLRPAKLKSRAAFRKAVMAKNGGWCVRCDLLQRGLLGLTHWPQTRAVHPHHWLPVGRGGKDECVNGIPLCADCHRVVHNWVKDSEEKGWLLKAGEPMNENARKIREWMEGKES